MTEMKLGAAWFVPSRVNVPVTQAEYGGRIGTFGDKIEKKTKMRVVYVAGPFRAENQWWQFQNIRRAEGLALEVWRMGAACICPHLNTAHFPGALPDEVWLNGDIEILMRCDAVLMTPDWQRSKGATEERLVALFNFKPVFYTLDALKEYLND